MSAENPDDTRPIYVFVDPKSDYIATPPIFAQVITEALDRAGIAYTLSPESDRVNHLLETLDESQFLPITADSLIQAAQAPAIGMSPQSGRVYAKRLWNLLNTAHKLAVGAQPLSLHDQYVTESRALYSRVVTSEGTISGGVLDILVANRLLQRIDNLGPAMEQIAEQAVSESRIAPNTQE